jgi:hypothetical protein
MIVMATATKTPVVTPRKIPADQGIEASACTAHHRLDSACLFGRVERIENQHITHRSQFTQEHESWNDDQWAHLQFVGETDTCHGVVVNYGFIISKLQHREVSSWFMSVSFCTEKCHMSQFAGRGVDEPPMFGDGMDTSCTLTLCSSP